MKETRKECGASREDDIGKEMTTHVEIGTHDRVVDSLVDSGVFLADEIGTEEDLGGTESLWTDMNDSSIGEFVFNKIPDVDLVVRLELFFLSLRILCNKANLLFNQSHDFLLGTRPELVSAAASMQKELEMICDVSGR